MPAARSAISCAGDRVLIASQTSSYEMNDGRMKTKMTMTMTKKNVTAKRKQKAKMKLKKKQRKSQVSKLLLN